jgi:hypothetical protein
MFATLTPTCAYTAAISVPRFGSLKNILLLQGLAALTLIATYPIWNSRSDSGDTIQIALPGW